MSYNSAFVADDSPSASLGCTKLDQENGGVKLIAFRPAANDRAEEQENRNELLNLRQESNGSNSPSWRMRAKEQHKSAAMPSSCDNLYMSTSLLSLFDNPTSNSPTFSHSTTSFVCAAIECCDMRYDVGFGRSKKTILHNINLNVPEGSIYGLLGPSGCGKTTMLRCVVGRIKPKSGYVRVFGYEPNGLGSRIPGPAVGYMPQEISVYDDFSIDETLTYFGRINKMRRDLIYDRIDFLLSFLDLPGKDRRIGSLSGGQKRRVSLAIALVHSPPLLILDEPTVGVDPLLRQSIWKHLVDLAQKEKITVLLTTHYIEEARQANVVGLMRNGKLLAEDSPENLMTQHGMDSLEDVFLKLCLSDSSRRAAKLAGLGGKGDKKFAILLAEPKKQQRAHPLLLDANKIYMEQSTKEHQLSANFVISEQGNEAPCKTKESSAKWSTDEANEEQQQNSSTASTLTLAEYKALQQKQQVALTDNLVDCSKVTVWQQRQQQHNLIEHRNNLRSMMPGIKYAPEKESFSAWFYILMAVIWKNYIRLKRNPPALFFEFIAPSVQVILFCWCIGGDPTDVPLAIVNDELIPQASKVFLETLNKDTVTQVPFDNVASAIESVRRGETLAAIHIPKKFTMSLLERFTHPEDVTNSSLANATVSIYPDLTNLPLTIAVGITFGEALIKVARDTVNTFGYEPEMAELPFKLEEPIYGTLKRSGFLEFIAPGILISVSYVMATALTALAFILEKRDGLLERSFISGVTNTQVLLGHAAVQVVVIAVQTCSVLATTFYVFQIPSHGPFFWVILLILLQGCTGMVFGLLVSAVCNEEMTAMMLLVVTFYTNLTFSGIAWPLESMPRWLKWFGYLQPQTLPTVAVRNIMSRGWGISEPGVYIGFLVTIAYLLVILLAAGFCMRFWK